MLRQHFNDRKQYSYGSRCQWAKSLGKQVILLGYIQQSQILDIRIYNKKMLIWLRTYTVQTNKIKMVSKKL